MNNRWDILGIGVVAVDDLLYVDHFPRADEKLPVKLSQRQGGGLTATALVAAARQGARAAYLGRLGDDELSRYSLAEFEREGIDTSPVVRQPEARPYHSTIIIDRVSGARTVLFDKQGVAEPDPAVITSELVASCKVLVIDHCAYACGTRAADFARPLGIPVVADIEEIDLPDLAFFLRHIDHLIVGIDVARSITERATPPDMAQALLGYGMVAAVVTDGARGCWYARPGGESVHFPAFPVEAIDTTGCGDVFHGAYAAAIGRGESVDRAVQIATATAGLKATQRGGRAGIPGLAQAERFLEANLSGVKGAGR